MSGNGKRYSGEAKAKVLKRLAAGESAYRIGKRTGIPAKTIRYWRERAKKKTIIEPKVEMSWLESGEYEAMRERTTMLERALAAHLIEEELKRYQ